MKLKLNLELRINFNIAKNIGNNTWFKIVHKGLIIFISIGKN